MSRNFYTVDVPAIGPMAIPADINIVVPQSQAVARERWYLLAYVPWDDKFEHFIPTPYRPFFRYVLPYLHAHTTDVYTALSVSSVDELVAGTPEPVDQHIVTVAVILHDTGWGQMTEAEIANSLDYSGLAQSPKAWAPKKRHADLGAEVAENLLAKYELQPALTAEQQEFICKIVYCHDIVSDRPDSEGPAPIEHMLTVEADKLWSYTYENFWLDAIRKGAEPVRYHQNLTAALPGYFKTPQGKTIAERVLAERKAEVGQLAALGRL